MGEVKTEAIMATPLGEEIGFADEISEMDIEIGATNDFELTIKSQFWNSDKYGYGSRFFIPGTEFGGLIEDIESISKSNEVRLRGYTWRGLLTQKVIEPPRNQDHLVLNGELNRILRELLAEKFGSLIVVPYVNTGAIVVNWAVDRYVTLYDAIEKLLAHKNYRMQLSYRQPEGTGFGYVELQAAPIEDYSERLEFSQDGRVGIKARDYRRGINHLVCAGKGQNEERIVIHLYVQEDGSIGRNQAYFGLDERAAVYNFTSAEADKLEEDGRNRLKELQNYRSVELSVGQESLEIGDIVSGYDFVTGISIKKPVTGKILKWQGGKMETEYKVKGEE